MQKLLREPLLHFFVLGGLLFALYLVLNRDAMRAPDEIVVDQPRLDALANRFERTWQRAPSPDELQGLVDAWVREEVLFREGMAAGLEQDDTVVRRRVVQKMQFMSDGIATDAAPTDAELQAWLDAHADDYRVDPRVAFEQVFFDPQRHRGELEAVVDDARAQLDADAAAAVGDRTLLPARMPLVSRQEVARVFGGAFAEGVGALPEGEWAGPVRSGFGVHLVRIEAREHGRLPSLAEVRDAVERDLARSRGEAAAESFYEGLRKRYTVRIEGDVAQAAAASAVEGARGQAARP